ncbi:MAG TPA: penicillin-binding transpeptidase domain-containing protein, partial [Egibacteraceae bacterium]|nr:penicillin-binding transpeptidase domain-containing protein [Egibacteraceae bacterium]
PAQAAQIAGIIPAPSAWDPADNPGRAHERYRYVLERMALNSWMDAGEAGRLAADPPATVAKRSVQIKESPFFLAMVERRLSQLIPDDRIYRGLTVTTTLDLGIQRFAESAYREHFAGVAAPTTGALVALDPGTGGIRALVGGPDYANDQLNLAEGSGRQPGSTFKPFALAAWVEMGRSPESYFTAPATHVIPEGDNGADYEVHNYGGAGYPELSLREATWRSVNTVYAQVAEQVTPQRIVDIAGRAGIGRDLRPEYSLVLGAQEVTPLGLAGAYNTFASGGVAREPITVLEIREGDRVLHTAQTQGRRAFSEQVAYTVSDVLRGVLTSGTGASADIGRPAAGKTGTTQDYGDAWFAGYTPHLTAVVWMGHRDDRARMEGEPTGGDLPAQLWGSFMATALAGVEPLDFPAPEGGLKVVRPSPVATPTPVVCAEGQTPSPLPTPPDDPAAPREVCVSPSPTETPTPTPTPSSTPTPTPTVTVSEPAPTKTPEPIITPTATPTVSPTPTEEADPDAGED